MQKNYIYLTTESCAAMATVQPPAVPSDVNTLCADVNGDTECSGIRERNASNYLPFVSMKLSCLEIFKKQTGQKLEMSIKKSSSERSLQ